MLNKNSIYLPSEENIFGKIYYHMYLKNWYIKSSNNTSIFISLNA